MSRQVERLSIAGVKDFFRVGFYESQYGCRFREEGGFTQKSVEELMKNDLADNALIGCGA